MKNLSDEIYNSFTKISTATLATCLYKKGLRNQYIQNVLPLHNVTKNMVGLAYTLRYIPAREDLNLISVFKDPNHPQRLAIENCPEGMVMVMDSRKDARAASAGAILTTRLMKRGVAGLVTDGGLRDSKEISVLNFPSYCQRPSAPTNLTLHQAIDINVPIACGDVAVFPGDAIVGDADGVIVIPNHLIEEVVKESLEMTWYETFVMKKVNSGSPVVGLYPATDSKIIEEYQRWKEKNSI